MGRIAGKSFSREQVAEAAWRVILREGLQAASVRAIATELGATTGVVSYHFRDKAELLLFALDRFGAAVLRQIEEALVDAVGLDRVRRILGATLPVGPAQIAGWRIWVSFVGMALNDKRLREEHLRRLEILNDRLATELDALRAAGLVRASIDPRVEADALVAICDGLGLGHLLRPKLYPPAKQWAIIESLLEARLSTRGPRPVRSGGKTKPRRG